MDDRQILDRYPLPIARGYRRCRNAAEVRERHDAAYYLFEIYLKYAASIVIAYYLAGGGRDHRVNAALKGLARPSLGEWHRFLRECLRFLAPAPEADPGIRSMAALYEQKGLSSERLLSLYNGLRSLRAGSPSDRDKLSLSMLLDEVVGYRNRVLGHGAPPAKEHSKRFGDLYAEAFPDLLEASPYLTARRLVAFDSLQLEGGHLEGGARIQCGVIEYMSDQPIRRESPHTIPYGSETPEKDHLHLLGEDGRFVSLDPLLIAHQEDVYILNEVTGSPEYLSYATGARHRPSGAGEAQQKLFERILGYRVDASKLSRIGDDLGAPSGEAAAEAPPKAPAGEGGRKLGDYRIVREVGRGAMGMVFEAVQESLGRRVALKVLPGDFALDPKRVERFRREARATARIHHPSIVPVYEVGEAEGTHFYAMEFLEGRSLDQLIEAARRTPAPRRKPGSSTASDPAYIARAVESMAALAEGLEEAHRLGLIHRDVKPSNILVDGDGRWVLVDFGLVHEAEAKTITRSGEMVGTLSYMSPEQVSRGRVDARADVYSLGVTLYEVLALRTPYAGTSDHEIQRAILFEEPLPPRKLNPRLHRDLETILLHALEKNPERRYASAREFAADLRRFLRYEPIRARAVSLPERLYRWCRNRAALVAVLAVVVACGLTTGLLLWKSRGAEFERERAESEAKFGAAERLYGEGRYQEALARLDEALAKKLAPLESRLLHAKVLGDMGRAAEAISELEGLAREKPGEGAVHALLAALYRGSDSRKADEHQALAEKFLPKEADAFFLRAIGSGSLKESLGFLTAALDEDPGHYASLKARAIAHQAQRDYSAMERDADRMTALRRQDPVGWTLHGVALRELGRLDEALRDLDRAARLAPADPEVLDHRREAHSLKGSNDQALADARRCAELRPNEVRYRFQVFNALVALGRFEEANAEYGSILGPGGVKREEFEAWATRHVFNLLGAKKPLNLPPRESGLPAFSALRDAAESYRHLESKADRLVSGAWRPAWSPDGTEIAYGRGFFGSNGLEVLDLKSGKTRLLAVPGADPAWSPDGRFIAFTSSSKAKAISALTREPIGTFAEYYAAIDMSAEEVWIVTPGGDGLRRLAGGGSATFSRRSARVFYHSRDEMALFAIAVDDPAAEPEKILDCKSFQPSVSPDEKLLAYHLQNVLHIVELPSGKPVAMWTAPPAQGLNLAWSPDGRELSVGGYDFDVLGLWIYDLATREARKVLNGDYSNAAWSPDRSRLAFDTAGLYWEIWVARLDPSLPTAEALGTTQSREEHFSDALRKHFRGLEEAEGDPELLAKLGSKLRTFLDALEKDSAGSSVDPLFVVSPRLPPYAAIDVILAAERPLDPGRDETLLAKLRALPEEKAVRNRLLYLEGKLLERSGKGREAAEKFGQVVAEDGSHPEPLLSLSRSLRAAGDPARAEKELRRALAILPGDRDLWTLWTELCLGDLGRSPAQLLGELPAPAAGPSEGAEDIRWLLGELRAGRALRIDCGGDGFMGPKGDAWSRDRFARGGTSVKDWSEDVLGTGSDPIYQTERRFPDTDPSRAVYRVPLPRGSYRIRLHFAEFNHHQAGLRRFDVSVQGKVLLKAYDAFERAGFATGDVQTLETRVDGGALEIRFVRGAGTPRISALEIEAIQ